MARPVHSQNPLRVARRSGSVDPGCVCFVASVGSPCFDRDVMMWSLPNSSRSGAVGAVNSELASWGCSGVA